MPLRLIRRADGCDYWTQEKYSKGEGTHVAMHSPLQLVE